MTPEQRTQVIAVARAWLRTPYQHRQMVKGAGCDCAMFPLAVYRECGLIAGDFEPPEYSMQWHLHHSEEKYLEAIQPLCREIEGPPLPADFAVVKFGRAFSHGMIVVEWPLIIHSYVPHGVQYGNALQDAELKGREIKFFEVKS